MTITAKIIADSISPDGIRLTTMQLRYPRFIHAELMTHRVFSRNASSSRAVPVSRLIEDVLRDPVHPTYWGKNQPGMQASQELTGDELVWTQIEWQLALDEAINRARRMMNNGAHKQIVNRVLEPYSHINVLVTSTEWANFYALRRHLGAQPEMRGLAHAMWDAQKVSKPKLLQPGQWHLPYITWDDWESFQDGLADGSEPLGNIVKISAARCARVSYMTHEGTRPSVESDIRLFNRLMAEEPLHATPTEHQATPDTALGAHSPLIDFKTGIRWGHPDQHGNFVGWRQYRKTFSQEYVKDR